MQNLAAERLRKLYKSNCGVTLRSKAESTGVLIERLQQLNLENKGKSLEAQYITRILAAVS